VRVVGRRGGVVDDVPLRQTLKEIDMQNLKTALVGATLAIATLGAFAQTPTTPRADQREANQQGRIAQGAASGELTARETNRLEKEQARVNTVEANAKADGKVTHRERAHLHRLQNRTSKDIYRQKHDGQVAAKP
jgi:capsular polysaccharide biosynthesis protein